jgi:predicted GNAT superfamily acetyltransferase
VAVPILENRSGAPVLNLDPAYLGQPLSIAIPDNIQILKQGDPELARQWRLALREALSWARRHGYAVREVADGAYIAMPEASR